MPRSDADQELLELQRAHHTSGSVGGTPSPAAVAADPDAINTWERRRAAQREAHGQFVAAANIHIGNCLAFSPGMSVPLEHIINFDLEDKELVYRVATPEQARVGKRFESEDDFHEANPHFKRRQALSVPEAHPDALDPRGGAAAKDDERRASAKKSASSSAKSTPAAKNQGE